MLIVSPDSLQVCWSAAGGPLQCVKLGLCHQQTAFLWWRHCQKLVLDPKMNQGWTVFHHFRCVSGHPVQSVWRQSSAAVGRTYHLKEVGARTHPCCSIVRALQAFPPYLTTWCVSWWNESKCWDNQSSSAAETDLSCWWDWMPLWDRWRWYVKALAAHGVSPEADTQRKSYQLWIS